MPYVTSIERLAEEKGKLEGKLEGKIQMAQELLGLPISSDSDLEKLSTADQNQLLTELRQQLKVDRP